MIKENVLSTLVYFIPEGTAVDGVTVSRGAKPDATRVDAGVTIQNWAAYELGHIERDQGPEFTQDRKGDVEISRPSMAGGYELEDVKSTQVNFKISFPVQNLSEQTLALVFGKATAGAIVSGTAYAGQSGKAQVKGVLKLQMLDETGAVVHVIDAYGILRAKSFKVPGGKLSEQALELTVLRSANNAGLHNWA